MSCVQGDDFVQVPRLIVEALLPSTETEDRTRKLDFYRRFPRLETVLLIWQDSRRVEAQERDGACWVLSDMIGIGTIRLQSLGLELGLEEIYAD